MKHAVYNGKRIWKATKREALRIVREQMGVRGKKHFQSQPWWFQNDCAVMLDNIAESQGSNWKNTFRDWM